MLVLAGFPEPETNQNVLDDAGGWIARPDLVYRLLKLALEYDGRQHAEDSRQWAKDIRRRELLDAAGWRTWSPTVTWRISRAKRS
jgi:very-short-patch-repair endonuclease